MSQSQRHAASLVGTRPFAWETEKLPTRSEQRRTGRSECSPDPLRAASAGSVTFERTWYSHGQNQGF
jgi:hypothetical protein